MKIVADPNIPSHPRGVRPLGDITLVPGRQLTAAHVRDADLLLVRSVTPSTPPLLDGSRIRFVATATIGLTTWTWPICRTRLSASPQPPAATPTPSRIHHRRPARTCPPAKIFGSAIKTLGVIGVGNVGTKVVRYARALGLRVLLNDPPRQRAENLPDFVNLDHLIAEADIITCHVRSPKPAPTPPCISSTHTGSRAGPILINSARGAVLDNSALLTAKLTGLVLDVWECEPHIRPGLLDRVDLGTPHIAGYSFGRQSQRHADDLRNCLPTFRRPGDLGDRSYRHRPCRASP